MNVLRKFLVYLIRLIITFACIEFISISVNAADELLIPMSFHSGWNFFSVPVKPIEDDPDAFFGDARNGPIWRFTNGRFIPVDSLAPGVGYWAFLETDIDIVFRARGNETNSGFETEHAAGWNMLGVISPISITPEVNKPIWRYSNQNLEIASDRLITGEGLWVWANDLTEMDLGSTTNDTDGDRVPDYWEFLWGLNFESEIDGDLDMDNDNLDSLFEFRAGTDPTQADTDADGLTDEKEVRTHQTNPRLADSDGDGINDNEEIQQGTNPLPGVNVLLIDDQGGFGSASDILTEDGHQVTVIINEFVNNRANLLNIDFLETFDLVIWGARGNGFGISTPNDVGTNLESYIQAGGNLLVTGIDSLGSPSDTVLADLVRATFPEDQASGSAEWFTANRDNFILNGVFGDFRKLSFSAIGYDDDQAIADELRGALTLAVTPEHSDKIIFTSLPFAGSVGYWNGGEPGSNTNAQPDFSSGGPPQEIFRNWVAGIRNRRGEGDIGFDTVPPVIELRLENDTGENESDSITSAPIITGSIMDDSRIVGFRAGFDDTPIADYVNVLGELKIDGISDLPVDSETFQISFEPAYIANQPAPGVEDGVVFSFLPHDQNPLYHVQLNNQGQIAFGARLFRLDREPLSNDDGIWLGQPGAVRLVVREGFPAPGTSPGTQFFSFNSHFRFQIMAKMRK